jgi:murein DD-endopeptidase MepM/ murein hydrolase activator NlpD
MGVLLAAGSLLAAASGRQDDTERRLRRLQREAVSLAAESERLQGLEGEILAGLAALTASRDAAAAEADAAAGKVFSLEVGMDRLAARVEEAETRGEGARRDLADRMRAMARRGPAAGLVALAMAPEPSAALGALRALSDKARLDQQVLARAGRLRVELAQARSALREQRQGLVAARGEALAARERASAALRRQEERLAEIRRRESLYRRAASEMERAAGDLARFLAGATREPPAGVDPVKLKGTLPWPSPGPLLAPFGPVRHPRFGTLVPHNGLDIGAPAGQPVRAVADGTVIFCDWFQGYGRTVIIDHGGGLMTVSSHLAEITATTGRELSVGDAIGLVGDSGTLEGPRLYFEIRLDGEPQEPMAWLAPLDDIPL